MNSKKLEKFWVGTFIALWVLVSTVSTVHSIEFFELSNHTALGWILAIGFEIGAMASLGGIILSKGNKTLIWMLFIILTAFQIHGNMYYAWTHSSDISKWVKLFDLVDEDINFQRRLFSFISGGILPIVSLGFIKSLMDYLDPNAKVDDSKELNTEKKEEPIKDTTKLDSAINNSTNLIEKLGKK
jgi:hypothetical protein